MSIPKAAGIETEYGIMIWGAVTFNPYLASQVVLNAYQNTGGPAIPMGYYYNMTTGNMYEDLEEAEEDSEKETKAKDKGKSDGKSGSEQKVLYGLGSLMLANGARFYIDHTHPEYCTPETRSARTAVAADKAGERIVARCMAAANQNGALPQGQQVLIYKNNSDYKGNSYGCHENYLLSMDLFEDLLRRRSHLIYRYLLPFMVSRVVVCGAGKVGYENHTPPTLFQLSQRADFFESLTGLQTTYQRPLFNQRDESHSNSGKFRRLHVILGDANLSEISTYLKIGTMQLVLSMMEDGFLKDDLTLAHPLAAFQHVSRDLTFNQPLALENGEQVTAVELQEQYLILAERYLEERGGSDEQWDVWERWADVLDALKAGNWQALGKQLDWAIKRNVLERYLASQQAPWEVVERWQPVMERTVATEDDAIGQTLAGYAGLDWNDYPKQREIYFALRRLDLEYHDIRNTGPEAGLFYRLQNAGHVDRLLEEGEVEHRITNPPDDTRAWLRGRIVERFSKYIVGADWSYVLLRSTDPTASVFRLELPNPLVGTQEDLGAVWDRLSTPHQMFAYFYAASEE